MRNLLTIAGAMFAIGAISTTAYGLHSALDRNYRLTHVLMRCDGSYVLYHGDRTEALRFVGSHCTDWGIVPNQDYDPEA